MNTIETQRSKVKKHLLSGKSITPLEALNLYGSFRLSAIIHYLRHHDNLDIETEYVEHAKGTRFASYKLKNIA